MQKSTRTEGKKHTASSSIILQLFYQRLMYCDARWRNKSICNHSHSTITEDIVMGKCSLVRIVYRQSAWVNFYSLKKVILWATCGPRSTGWTSCFIWSLVLTCNITNVALLVYCRSTVGVFCCGPSSLISSVRKQCFHYTSTKKARFVFNKECF